MKAKEDINVYITNILLFLLGLALLAFPLVFTTLTSDNYGIPKQAILGVVSLLGLIFFAANTLVFGKVKIRKTPYDLALFLFTLAVFLSALFSTNRADALIAFTPLFFVILTSFLIVNAAKEKSSLLFLFTMFLIGACTAAVFALLSVFGIHLLPIPLTQTPTFTPLGSYLDLLLFLVAAFFIAVSLALPIVAFRQIGIEKKTIAAIFASIILFLGIGASVYQLMGSGRVDILPIGTGFQTAFAAISQDASRPLQSFLFGSGIGTFVTDFTRFKNAIFNQTDVWNLTFYRSSTYLLELLATTGLLGAAGFMFLLFTIAKSLRLLQKPLTRIKENPVFLSLAFLAFAALFLPFSFVSQATFFFVLGLFAAAYGLSDKERFFDIDLYLFADRKEQKPQPQQTVHFGFDTFLTPAHQNAMTKFLPVSFFIVSILLTGVIGFYSTFLLLSDLAFQRSFTAYGARDSLKTYNEQRAAIAMFPYRDGYYRVYSQFTLELASSLLASIAKEKSPNQRVQRTIYDLIQDSINAARSATTLSPLTVTNWQNLAAIYRNLIGFGKDAENFAIASAKRAISLDPNNPQAYINLGGIYYQLGRWEDAQRQFQIAVSLKPDFANAHYNLGHALEQKGDIELALQEYEVVKSLTAKEKSSNKKITEEIEALQTKIGEAKTASPSSQLTAKQVEQPPLSISTPSATLPSQNPPVAIPAPNVATQSAEQ
ncbi:MAG: tetratricopeptide repeat protein [Candidatus Levybacteria bacterium]|nr:tetratricopeptide repeat protein [Candidatus Levybacteria bacterium]